MFGLPTGAPTEPGAAEMHHNQRRARWAGLIGTALEQYDFVIYGTASALVFNTVFFPDVSATVGYLGSFSAYAVGFFARPLGGLFFSRFGDRLGRKWVLVATLALMGTATFAIGLLPGYASIGFVAPVLLVLLRCAQGFGAGAEMAGGTVLLTETAPEGRRGRNAAMVWVGASGGTALGALVWLVVQLMPEEDLVSHGWRLVFFSSAAVTVLAFVLRRTLRDSHVFTETRKQAAVETSPIKDVWRNSRRNVLRVFAMVVGVSINSYIYQVFLGSYLVAEVQVDKSVFTQSLLVGALAGMPAAYFFGWLSDRIGRRRAFTVVAVGMIAMPVPSYLLLDTGHPVLIALVIVLGFVFAAEGSVSAQAAFLPEIFGSRYRYAGVTLGREMASMVGGTGPLVCSALVAWASGSWVPVAILMMAVTVVSLIATVRTPETRDRDLYTEADAA
ncbi:MFS transporter [Saccharopolyspora subtropica]|uniref:MFS transporter n=1 Tax=Saccharopolyspora thermophila TaxID=89367 RepID=A0A917K7G3_9PSEU|nr:MFS transporter [Saccharopolyspora subtropica]GGJ01870.1 MFS transporter [Saccharopolyspora subtropica]